MRSDWRAGGHRTRLAVNYKVAVRCPEDSPSQLTVSERYVPRGKGTSSRLSRARRGASLACGRFFRDPHLPTARGLGQ
jgi:hypothetical protein